MKKRKVKNDYAQSDLPSADPHLMEAFKFTAHDLLFNRHGDLSDAQFKQLHNNRRFITYGLIGGAFLAFCLWLSTFAPQSMNDYDPSALGILALITCIGLLFAVPYMRNRYSADMYTTPIESISDVINLDIEASRTYSTKYTMRLGYESFKLNKKQFLALKNRDIYTIYYTANTKRLLSLDHEEATL